MADNFTVLDGNGAPRVLRSTDSGGVHTPHQKVELPGTAETDIGNTASRLATIVTALGSHLATLAGAVTSNRVAVDLTVAVTSYLSAFASAAGSAIAQDRTTFAAPSSTRLSTGAAFYDAAKTGQLPTALGQTTMANSLCIAHASDDPTLADTVGTATALGALNASAAAGTVKGKRSVGFVLVGGGTLVGTLTAECFMASAYEPTYFFDPLTGATASSIAVSSPVSNIVRGILMLPGGSNVRVRVSAYTSGTSQGLVAHSNVNPTLGMLQSLVPATTVYDGNKNVTTAGTRVVLASSQALTKGVRVRAKDANTGLIYIGGASVSSASDRLAPGEPTWLDVNNLANVWLDAAVSGEGVTFSAW